MRDDLFGTLTRRDGGWEGQAAFGYLATFGQALDEDDADDPRPPLPPETGPTRGMIEARGQLEAILAQSTGDVAAVLAAALGSAQRAHQAPGPSLAKEKSEPTAEELALRRGVCDLAVDTGARHGKPSRAQRAAWRALLDRGDALWDEIAAHALAAYRRQRPMRVRMWRRVYGDHLLDRRLPEAGTVAAMKGLIRPRFLRVQPPADENAVTSDIAVHCLCTWHAEGFGAIIRDGGVAEIGPVLDLVHSAPRPRRTIEHAVLGTLTRVRDNDPWDGRVRFDAMLDYGMTADARAAYMRDRDNADRPGSRMAWEFADGEFAARVYTGDGQPPDDAQAEALERFRAGQDGLARSLVDAVFRRYQEVWRACRQNYRDRYVEENIPELTSADGLRDLMQLRHVHVHEPGGGGRVTIAMQFVCAWDYDGFSAVCRDGGLVGLGRWKDAIPH
jgi:hypothetical protein